MKLTILVPARQVLLERAEREAATLRDAGHAVTVLAGGGFLRGRIRAGLHLLREDLDAVHVVGRVLPWLVLAARRIRGFRLIYESHEGGISPPFGRWAVRRARRAERLLVRRASAVVAASDGSAADMARRLELTALPVVVRHAPELPPREMPAELRGRLGIGSRRLVVHAGPVLAIDTCEAVIDALARTSDVHVAFLGADRWTDRDRVHLAAERSGVAGRIHLLRGVAPGRLLDYLDEADAGLTVDDGRGRCDVTLPPEALAYLAADVPVVAAGLPEVGRVIETAASGWFVSDLEAEPLAQCLDSIRRLKRRNGRRPEFGWVVESRKLVDLYVRVELEGPLVAAASLRRADLRLLRRALAEARSELTRAAARRPRAASAFVRGRRLRGEGRYAQGAELLVRAREMDVGNSRYAIHAAAALKDAGRREEAIAAYREMAATGSPTSSSVATAGVALAQLGARRDAEDVLRSLDALEVKTPATWVRIGTLRAALGDVEAAADAAASAGPGATGSLARQRVRLLEQAGRPSEARDAALAAGIADAARRLEGTLRALDPGWRPVAAAGRDRPGGPRVAGRVLHLLETSLPHAMAGYAHRSHTVLRAQVRCGLDPVVATRVGFPANRRLTGFAPVEAVDGVIHHRFTLPGVHRYSAIPADELVERNVELAAGLVARLRPAAIQAGTPHLNGLVALALGRAFDVPAIYDVRGFPEMTWAVRQGGDRTEIYQRRREAETGCMVDADRVITLSDVMKAHIVGRGVDASKVFVVPHAVDIDAFRRGRRDAELARRYGLEGRTVFGCVTSLLEYEGIDTLIRAVASLRRGRPDVAALVVGDGPALPALERLVADLGVGDSVTLAGRVPHSEVEAHYGLLDAFVLPRRDLEVCRYVTPLKPFEAMAMGLCLVASDLPVLRELVGDDERGFLFRPDDSDHLAEILAGLADDPALGSGRGDEGRQFVAERHSFTAIDAATRAALDAVSTGAV